MFSVETANRDPALAINLFETQEGLPIIPGVSETKEYGQKYHLDYSVPRFIGQTGFFICSKYKKKHQEFWVTQINPLILKTEGFVFVEETQHGVEGIYLVPRHPRILVAYTEAGTLRPVQRELVGLAALQFQQALEAANGLFISDFGLRIDDYPEYLEGTEEEQNKIAEEYFKALKEEFSQQLEENPDTKEYLKAAEFMAENIELSNAREGVLPEELAKKLEKANEE